MAEINFDFRNIGSKKCAVSSPRIVNLEIGDESPGCASESTFQDFFLRDQHCHSDVRNNNGLICEYDKKNDKNFLIHSQLSLSTFTCDDRPFDKIKATSDNDTDFDLLDLLNSAKSEPVVKTRGQNFNFKKNTPDDKMKIISNTEVSDGLSDIFSCIVNEKSGKDEIDSTLKDNQRSDSQDCEIGLLDFDFVKNGCAQSLSSNNSSLKVEGNLSDLLSSINIDDSDVSKVGTFSSNNMCYSKVANKFETIKEPCVSDLSDLLSSIDLGNTDDNKSGSYNQSNDCYAEASEIKNSCLADLLSSTNIDKSNKPTSREESSTLNLSDLLSSIDLGDSNDNKIDNCNQADMCNAYIAETKQELCLAGKLPSVDINKSATQASTVLYSKPLSLGSSNLYLKDTNGTPDMLNDLTFDFISGSSSVDSCSSSYSDKENNSPKESLREKNLLTDTALAFDSGYSSFDSMHKEFSFFDYSSGNQFSIDTLLTNKSDNSLAMKNGKEEDTRNANEEMSMSDLMTIVSPEFKNPVLTTLNKTDQLVSCMNEDSSSMLDLMECLNIKSKNSDSHIISNDVVDCNEKLMNYDCVDSPLFKNGMRTNDSEPEAFLIKEDILIGRSDYVDDNNKIASDDELSLIDLRECIKSAKHQFSPTSPNKQIKSNEVQSLKCFSPTKILLYSEDKSISDISQSRSNPIEFNDMTPKKKSRVNTKQTMFSKALACKPKKDHSLLQKVANIKNELMNSIINRPVFINCDVPQPVLETVIQSDRCILPNVGRKSFGLDVPCEMQY